MVTQRASRSLLLLALWSTLSACGPGVDDGAKGGLAAVFRAEDGGMSEGARGEHFVGHTSPGKAHTARLILKNVGDTAVSLSPIEALGGAFTAVHGGPSGAIFNVAEPEQASLVPGAQTELEITFAPPREGRFISAFRVNSVVVTLVGLAERTPTSPAPDLVLLSGDTYSFGRVPHFPAAPAPSVRRVWVTNVGTQAATLERATVRSLNPNSADAELDVRIPADGHLPAHAPDSALALELRVSPTTLGPKQWEVSLLTSDPDTPELLIQVSAEAVTPAPCHLMVRQKQLDFGIVYPPDHRELGLEISNEGAAPNDFCIVWDVQLAPESDPAFVLPNRSPDAAVIGQGKTLEIPIRFFEAIPATTSDTVRSGLVTFKTSAENRPLVEIPLTAIRPVSGCITVAPAELDYGTLSIGCESSTRTFNLYNHCSDEVVLTAVRMQSAAGQPAGGANCPGASPCPEFHLVGSPAIPAGGRALTPGEVVTLVVKHRPIDLGADTGALALDVRVGERAQTHVLTLHGRGDSWATHTDVFVSDPPPKRDVLFVIDDSASMANHQASIAANFAGYLQTSAIRGEDFRLAVVTATASGSTNLLTGAGHPDAVLTQATPDLAVQLAAKVDVGSGGTGGPRCFERALEVLVANPDFVRSDATLDVVCISDSADVSPLPVPDYLDALWRIKGLNRKTLFSFNAIGGFSPGCPGDNGRLADAVMQANGVKDDICTPDWWKTLDHLSMVWFGFNTRYFLTALPDLGRGPIEVTINGVPMPPFDSKGNPVWRYDAMSNSVDFEPMYVPERGKTLVITYPTGCYR